MWYLLIQISLNIVQSNLMTLITKQEKKNKIIYRVAYGSKWRMNNFGFAKVLAHRHESHRCKWVYCPCSMILCWFSLRNSIQSDTIFMERNIKQQCMCNRELISTSMRQICVLNMNLNGNAQKKNYNDLIKMIGILMANRCSIKKIIRILYNFYRVATDMLNATWSQF